MEITVETTIVNGKRSVIRYNGSNTLPEALRNIYEDQGDFYLKEFGISREDAHLAGWHENDRDFSISCEGWKQFISAGGKIDIKKTVVVETVPVASLVFTENE